MTNFVPGPITIIVKLSIACVCSPSKAPFRCEFKHTHRVSDTKNTNTTQFTTTGNVEI